LQRFKELLKRFLNFAIKNIYAALFLLIGITAAIIAKDYVQGNICIFKDIRSEGIDENSSLMYAADWQSTHKNGFDITERTVLVDDAGVVREYVTNAATVSELFDERGIKLGPYDVVVPQPDGAIASGMTAYITRVDYIVQTVETKIPFETVINDVDTVMKGTTVVAVEGKEGLELSDVAVKCVNGVITNERKVISSTVVKEPEPCIKEHGVGGTFRAPNGKVYKYLYRRRCVATAYYDAYNRGKVATGHATVPGIVAVDWKVIPLHSRVYVTGKIGDFGILRAEDVGNFRGDWIDIYFDTIEECFAFGRQTMDVYVLEVSACDVWVHDPAQTQDIGYPGPNWYYNKNKAEKAEEASESNDK
jgi:3D (Asp-Asp-Asp) domain-containing protein